MCFKGRIRGSGIIRVVERAENDWNDFVLARLCVRLIVMCSGIGGSGLFASRRSCGWEWRTLCTAEKGTAIFSHLNFSLKREEPFCILRWSRPLHLNPHHSSECKTPQCALLCNYLSKIVNTACCCESLWLLKNKLQYQTNDLEHYSWHQNDWATGSCHANIAPPPTSISNTNMYCRLWAMASL